MADFNQVVEKVIEQTDIVALASEFVSLTKRGKNFMGLCPFHDEKTPSFSVSPEKKIAKCMGCGMGGNTVTFYAQMKNISFREATIELAQRLGLEVSFEGVKQDPNEKRYHLMEAASNFFRFALKNSEAGQKALAYLQKRKLSDDEIEHFDIGFAPSQKDALYQMLKSKNFAVTDMMQLGLVNQRADGSYYDLFRGRVTFPIKNKKGRIVGFSGRTLNPKEPAKYINSPETRIFKKGELLYHLSDSMSAAIKQKNVILHEGFFDVIASFKAGFLASVATMGTALTKEQAALIRSITKEVIVAYDGDQAGIDATLKAVPILRRAGLNVSILKLPQKLDPDDFVQKEGILQYQALFKESLIDPYQFGYNIFKQNKDFKKASDITKFKKELEALLSGVDQAVVSLYEQQIKTELGLEIKLLTKAAAQIPLELPIKKEPIAKPTISKAERAIDLILIHLLLTHTYLEQTQKRLDLAKISTVGKDAQIGLYKDLMQYYSVNKTMDIHQFKVGYVKNQAVLEKYLNAIEYKKKIQITSDQVFDDYIQSIDTYEWKLEIEHLKEQILEKKGNLEQLSKKLQALLKKGRGSYEH